MTDIYIHISARIYDYIATHPYHRDGGLSLLDFRGELEHAVSIIWALDGDFTPERGTTRVVPTSKDWARNRLPVADEVAQPSMQRGSCLMCVCVCVS